MKATAALFVIPAVLFAVSFTDDFESYTPGNYLDTSPYWFRADTSDYLVVVSDGGNNVVETAWTDKDNISYQCPGAAEWLDGTIGVNFRYTGSDAVLGLLARGNAASSECYMAGVYTLSSQSAYSMIMHVTPLGAPQVLTTGYISTLNENTWYSLSLEISGTDPVTLTLNLDDSMCSTCQDSVYKLPAGWSGMGMGYQYDSPVFLVDSFFVEDNTAALEGCTFAGIKALFQ